MSDLIVANEVSGASVYGVAQYSYTVDGVSGQDYAAALTAATFQEATAIETAASAYADLVRQRQAKLTALGDALAVLAKALASMPVKNQSQSDPYHGSDISTAYNNLVSFNISPSQWGWGSGNIIIRAAAMRAQNGVQYELDRTDNDLQQDMVSLQSLMSKRDSAFSTASRIVKKADNAAASTIQAMT